MTVDLADGKLALARVGAMNGLLLGYSWEYVLEYVGHRYVRGSPHTYKLEISKR